MPGTKTRPHRTRLERPSSRLRLAGGAGELHASRDGHKSHEIVEFRIHTDTGGVRVALRLRFESYEYLPRTAANLELTDIRAQHPNATEPKP